MGGIIGAPSLHSDELIEVLPQREPIRDLTDRRNFSDILDNLWMLESRRYTFTDEQVRQYVDMLLGEVLQWMKLTRSPELADKYDKSHALVYLREQSPSLALFVGDVLTGHEDASRSN